jgi:hypothetical protein
MIGDRNNPTREAWLRFDLAMDQYADLKILA